MVQVWLNPNPSGPAYTPRDMVWVDSSVAPTTSPAPAGNALVPTGYVLQIARDGSQDTIIQVNGQYVPYVTQFVVPYYTGGWPPDPLAGQPGHTGGVWNPR